MIPPDVKSEWHLDPITGQRYLMTKVGGGTSNDGSNVGEFIQKDIPAKAESWKFQDGNTITNGGAAYETADVSLFLPFDNLKISEDGSTDVTWSIQLRPGSKGVINVTSATGSIKVQGIVDAVDTIGEITVSTTAGVKQVAALLTQGTYFIEV